VRRCNGGSGPNPFGSALPGLVCRGCMCALMIGPSTTAMRLIGVPHNHRLKLTGAAVLVFRASTSLQRPRQLSLGVSREVARRAIQTSSVAELEGV
jgi:hypothetical protein